MTTTPMRIGVIGVGFGTVVQIPGFQSEGVDVAAVCARRQERVDKAAADFNIPAAYTDYRKMLQEADIDAVSIVTPPALHHEMAIAALDAGKHVICEKPFAMDQGQAREMWQEAEATGLTAMVSHEFRFAPARAYVKELLEQGYVGDLRFVNTTLFAGPTQARGPRPMAWGSRASEGGGFLGALGSHYIDGLRYWCGEVTAVKGGVFTHDTDRLDPESGQAASSDTDDAFGFMLRFESGAWASMSGSTAAPFGPGAHIEVYGSSGTLITPQPGMNPPPDGTVLGANFDSGPEVRELPMPERFRPFDDDRDGRLMAFRLLLQRFIQGVESGTSPGPNFYDGFRCQQVLDAVRDSSGSDGWVQLER